MVTLPLEALRESLFLPHLLMDAGTPWLWQHHSILCLWACITFFSVCIMSLCVLLVWGLVIACRAYPGNPESSRHLKIVEFKVTAASKSWA
jgi:hypothetical protein